MPSPRFTIQKSNGAYGEWEVLDNGKVMVPYAWLSRAAAKAEAERLERGEFHDQDEEHRITGTTR